MKKIIPILITLVFILSAVFPIATAVAGDVQTYEEEITSPSPPFDYAYLYAADDFGFVHTFDPSNKYIISAKIQIRAFDIDSGSPWYQEDKVYAEGEYLGILEGVNMGWSVTEFDIDPLLFADGELYISINIDSTSIGSKMMVDYSRLIVEYQPHVIIEKLNHGDMFVPVETEVYFPLEIYVENPLTESDDDLEYVYVLDGIGAEFDLVLYNSDDSEDIDGIVDDPGDYIFKIGGTPVTSASGDIYYGYSGDIVWWQANLKTAWKNKGCATKILWDIGTLTDDNAISLEFTIKTKSWQTGNSGKTKQSFTSTCHHTLNDGVYVYYDIGDDHYTIQGEPVEVSVYDPEPGADSDGDGIEDWYEVEMYGSDPCGANIFVGGFDEVRSRAPLLSTEFKDALDDSDNFGPMGIVPYTIAYVPFVEEILEESLVDEDDNLMVNLFFAGLTDIDITEGEAIELERFLDAGGILYICGNSNPEEGLRYNPLFTELGWADSFSSDVVSSGSYGDTTTPVSTSVTTGPFGIVGPLEHTPFSAFDPVTAINVATGYDPSATPECIVAEGAYGANGGYISIMGDPLYFDLFMDDDDNLNYFLNLFALATP